MTLVMYGHPFSSYTQKALIALYENDTPFEFRLLYGGSDADLAEWRRRWPIAKFPLLVDGDRQVAEATIIIEYLQLTQPGSIRLLPDDPLAALDVRFFDRFFDLHIMDAAQHAVNGAISQDPVKLKDGKALSAEKLERAYGWLETQLPGKTWATGEAFTMADCAAAPFLFYADWTHPIGDAYPGVRAYRARLLARPSMVRVVNEARPYRHLFPLGAPDRD